MPFFSLVVSTKGRVDELVKLFESLQLQTYRDFEVVVVDQNDDGLIERVVARDWGFALGRLSRPQERGLSRGRNVGWKAAQGTYVAFPDDDCWYDADFLEYAAHQLSARDLSILTGRAAALSGRSINGRFKSHPQIVATASQVWTTQIEWVAFFRRDTLVAVGGYDESIGVGADSPWQACEGQDIVLRALDLGANCYFDPKLVGRHAELRLTKPSPELISKARAYGRGMGYVLRKHRFFGPVLAYWVARPLLRALLVGAQGKWEQCQYYWAVSLGRLEGMRGLVDGKAPMAT